jgi:hypothetical protein
LALLDIACAPNLISPRDGLTHLERAKVMTDSLDAKVHSKVMPADASGVCPKSDQVPDKIYMDYQTAGKYVDPDRAVKDVATDFVVSEFFNTPETLFNFINLVYGKLDTAIKDYREKKLLDDDAIVFIFKGGNVMRMIANHVFAMIPPNASKILKDKYNEFFKRSDADFSVLVNHEKLKDLNYEAVMSDLMNITYNTLGEIRTEITEKPFLYSNFSQLNSKVASERLEQYFEKLQEAPALTDPENSKWYGAKFTQLQLQKDKARKGPLCKYLGHFDYLYQFDGPGKTKIVGIPIGDKRSKWIMNTINKTLEWPSGLNPKDLIKFYLVRSKVQFEYTFKKDGVMKRVPIGGELIDVSFPHKDDFRLAAFFDNLDTDIADYQLTMSTGDTDETITMKAESLSGLATDVYEVIFEQFPRPWEASKYDKRINRLLFFSIVEMLKYFGLGSPDTAQYVQDIEEKVIPLMENVDPGSDNAKAQTEEVLKALSDLKETYPKMNIANHFFEGLGEIVTERFFADPKETDKEEFKKLLEVVKGNLDIIKDLSNLPRRKVDLSKLYKMSMKNLF